MDDVEALARAVARNVAALRRRRGITLDELAARSGVSKGMAVQVEQARTNPSIGTLVRLANGLGVSVADLVQEAGPPPVTAVPAGSGTRLWVTAAGSSAELLVGAGGTTVVELWSWTIAPGERHAAAAHTAGAFEMLHVLEGRLALEVDGTRHEVGPGGAVRFLADRPHAYACAGDAPVRFEMVTVEPGAG
jgi:transcriptional regulator with XRE-family HTH domain/mannose-6-phosphate isomerase-like protein (cupin superfamily)